MASVACRWESDAAQVTPPFSRPKRFLDCPERPAPFRLQGVPETRLFGEGTASAVLSPPVS